MTEKVLTETYSTNKRQQYAIFLCAICTELKIVTKFAWMQNLGRTKSCLVFGDCLNLRTLLNFYTEPNKPTVCKVFMPPKELWEAYSNRTVRPSVRPSVRVSVRPAFVSGPYLPYSLRYEFQIRCVDASWDGGVSRTIFGSL